MRLNVTKNDLSAEACKCWYWYFFSFRFFSFFSLHILLMVMFEVAFPLGLSTDAVVRCAALCCAVLPCMPRPPQTESSKPERKRRERAPEQQQERFPVLGRCGQWICQTRRSPSQERATSHLRYSNRPPVWESHASGCQDLTDLLMALAPV